MIKLLILPLGDKKSSGPFKYKRTFVTLCKSKKLNIKIYDYLSNEIDKILVINGSKHLLFLLICKLRKKRIYLRLGVPNKYIWGRSIKNKLIILLRNFQVNYSALLADQIIFQSFYSKNHWKNNIFVNKKRSTIIYNTTIDGINTIELNKIKKNINLLFVEGKFTNKFIQLINEFQNYLQQKNISHIKLITAGQIDKVESFKNTIIYQGVLNQKQLNNLYLNSHYLMFLDLTTAACPNTVIEALSHGIPVIHTKSDLMTELLHPELKILELTENKNNEKLFENIINIVSNTKAHINWRQKSKKLYDEKFSITRFTDSYYKIINT